MDFLKKQREHVDVKQHRYDQKKLGQNMNMLL